MTLADCLPDSLRGPATTITPIAAGMSGAGVYRVEAAGATYVLKVATDGPFDVAIVRSAADAGLAPRVIHVDDARYAMVSEFVASQPIMPSAELLGTTLRRVHALPIPAGAVARDAKAFLATLHARLADFRIPDFATAAIERFLAEPAPPCDRVVLSHNDVNPSNLAYDGERLVLLDWDAAGPNDPYYDLATIAVFLRMDPATCARLFAAYGIEPSPRFAYDRRAVALQAGAAILHTARLAGHAGGDAPRASVLTLAEFYQRMRSGELALGTPDGQWAFGLALLEVGGTQTP